jgi:ubiquinone/menaquinone biosynthesis C-methylase UbiE
VNAITSETERVRAIWDRSAEAYERSSGLESWLLGDGRSWAASQASGRTLEIAIGTGLNLPHYGSAVRLTGIDISPAMLDRASRRARHLGRDMDLVLSDAQQLPFEDASFDTVVCTLSLCSIPDDAAAIEEAFASSCQAADSSSSSTSGAPCGRYGRSSGASNVGASR